MPEKKLFFVLYLGWFQKKNLSREAQLVVGWVGGSVTHAGVGFHASTQPTFFGLAGVGFRKRI